MESRMQIRLTGLTLAAFGGLFPAGATAQTLELTVAIPKLTVAEYHRPYVAIWLEKQGVTPRTIAVWYDHDMKANEGTKWLRDVRQWWRASGRTLSFPADGITGATRAPGSHKLSFVGGRGSMPALTPGAYTLVVEAAREVGGRELVRLPFNWDGAKAVSARAAGSAELGAVSQTLKR
jgi:hypothetical protein